MERNLLEKSGKISEKIDKNNLRPEELRKYQTNRQHKKLGRNRNDREKLEIFVTLLKCHCMT